jgi:HlyD family secretion protein
MPRNYHKKITALIEPRYKIGIYIVGGLIVLFILLTGLAQAHFFKKKTTTTPVVAVAPDATTTADTAAVPDNTIASANTVTGTGQVSALSHVSIAPTITGQIASVAVHEGQKVAKGQVLFTYDTADAAKAIRDAQVNVQNATVNLQSTIAQNKATQDDLALAVKNTYQDLLNSTIEALPATVPIDLPAPTITGNYSLGKPGDILITVYTSVNGISFNTTGLIIASGTVRAGAPEPLDSSGLFISFAAVDPLLTGTKWVIHIPNIKASNYLSNYNKYQSALRDVQKNNSVGSASAAALQAAQVTLQQHQNELVDAQNAFNDATITAPFDGIVTSLSVVPGQFATTGGELATMVSNKQDAMVLINENDIAKVKVGQKVILKFDAIDGLALTGRITEIDTAGIQSQGVTSYGVKISFLTTDPRVKIGMSVAATIATQ